MTNGWIDIKNTDMRLIEGGNPAENHPCGFKWAIEAKRNRNARMIVVDPRFTRTAATADLFLQIRAGTDIAFLGGLIRYAVENNRIARDYLVNFTNAAFIIKDGFKLPEDGLYSGFDEATKLYDRSTWNYEAIGEAGGAGGTKKAGPAQRGETGDTWRVPAQLPPNVAHDPTLQHPHGGDAAAAARQRRARRRRRQRAARALEHPGRDRHGRRVRHPARLPENAGARRRRSGDVPQADDADFVQAARVGLVQLLVEHA